MVSTLICQTCSEPRQPSLPEMNPYKVAFSKLFYAARARIGQNGPNHGTFTAKTSNHHVHVILRVTPPTSPCPTLSFDAEPTCKHVRLSFLCSVQYDVTKSAL